MGDVEVRPRRVERSLPGVPNTRPAPMSCRCGSRTRDSPRPSSSSRNTRTCGSSRGGRRSDRTTSPRIPCPLLMGIEAAALESEPQVALSDPIGVQGVTYELPESLAGGDAPRVGMYKGHQEPMIAGWTRWMLDKHGNAVRLPPRCEDPGRGTGGRLRRPDLPEPVGPLDQPGQPAGLAPGAVHGRVSARRAGPPSASSSSPGGRLVVMEEAADFAIALFGLDVGNPVEGLSSTDFYVPGSILRVDLANDPLSSGYDGLHRRLVLAQQPRVLGERRPGRCRGHLQPGEPRHRGLDPRAGEARRDSRRCCGRGSARAKSSSLASSRTTGGRAL